MTMKKENILWGIIAIGLLIAIISPFLPSFNKNGNLLSKVQTTLPSKSPFDNYKIDISTGKTETEKTMIVKFNNVVVKITNEQTKTTKKRMPIMSQYIFNMLMILIHIYRQTLRISVILYLPR